MNNSDKKVAPKRKGILAKTRRLFWEKGYHETTMKDIGNACRCEPSNIYNYFPSKEALLYEIIIQDVGLLVSSIKHLENDDLTSPAEQLQSLIKNHINISLGYRRTAKLLFEIESELRILSPAKQKKIFKLRDDYDRILQKIIRRGIDAGVFAEVDVKLVNYCIASMIIRTRLWYSPRGRLSADEIADGIFKFTLNGIAVH